jgi:hypothetical protein
VGPPWPGADRAVHPACDAGGPGTRAGGWLGTTGAVRPRHGRGRPGVGPAGARAARRALPAAGPTRLGAQRAGRLQGDRAVVFGASMAGLAAARVLAEAYEWKVLQAGRTFSPRHAVGGQRRAPPGDARGPRRAFDALCRRDARRGLRSRSGPSTSQHSLSPSTTATGSWPSMPPTELLALNLIAIPKAEGGRRCEGRGPYRRNAISCQAFWGHLASTRRTGHAQASLARRRRGGSYPA